MFVLPLKVDFAPERKHKHNLPCQIILTLNNF